MGKRLSKRGSGSKCLAGNPHGIEKNRLKIENLQISELIFANHPRTLTSIWIFFSCNILSCGNLILSKSPCFLESVIIFTYLVNPKVINDN